MNETEELPQFREQLRQAIAEHLHRNVVQPAMDLVESDFAVQDDVASMLVLHKLIAEIAIADAGVPLDRYLLTLVDRGSKDLDLPSAIARAGNTAAARTIFGSYVGSLAEAISVSILSASYLSGFITTRSLLELVITVGGGKEGTMSERIGAMAMLTDDEHVTVSQFWRELNGWAHPYGRWIRELCPVLVTKRPQHHPKVAQHCVACLAGC